MKKIRRLLRSIKPVRILYDEILTLRKLVRRRLYVSSKSEIEVTSNFHKLYYDSHHFGRAWAKTFWFGVPTLKCPLDMWIYQEIIYDLKPDVIIECGTAQGGSALFLASLSHLLGHGKVITIDIEDREGRPELERISYVRGSSTSEEIVEKVKSFIKDEDKVMVILDSDHTREHVLNELRMYSSFVTKGSYLIVEDTNLNGHPVVPDFGPGPMEAIEEFLKENKNFVVDRDKEHHYLTFNPKGFLRKIA